MDPEDQNGPWWQCYRYFCSKNHVFDREIAGLRLAFYLSAFGMFRGDARLRKKNLDFFTKAADFSREFSNLRGLTISQLQLDHVQNDVAKYLRELRKFLGQEAAGQTDTLITKIALGTTACVPAYDRFAKEALKKRNNPRGVSKRSLSKMFTACQDGGYLADLVRNPDSTVPIMRHLDRQLWQRGKSTKDTPIT
jgi:hypothetical protein